VVIWGQEKKPIDWRAVRGRLLNHFTYLVIALCVVGWVFVVWTLIRLVWRRIVS
jgi:hypothetical protein